MSHGERAKTKQVTQDDVIYFVVTDRFFGKNKQHMDGNVSDTNMHGGTLDGIIDKLGYLKELGVTAIWVTPAYKNIHKSGDTEPYHYYWASNFLEMDSRLLDGTHLGRSNDITTFRKFVEICEGKGFKVILDMIVNHAGYGAERHFPSDWFHRQVNNDPNEFTKWVGGLPDFDQDKPEVLDYHIKQLEKWIVDGDVTNIRMDTAKHVDDKFWYYFKSQIRGQYPNTVLIGEVLCEGKDDVSRLERYQNFHDFDSVFDFPLCTALRQTLIYDESIQYWLACPRVGPNEPPGVLDNDNSEKGGYRNPNFMVTLLDNHDLQRRIMSHARTKHTGDSNGLDMAIKVDKLRKEREIYEWTKSLIALRKNNAAFRYGTTITLWADNLVYAFLRISTHDVALVIINNGYLAMPDPIQLRLNHDQIPQWVVEFIRNGNLKHWQTRQVLTVHRGDMVHLTVEGKTIDIYCANP